MQNENDTGARCEICGCVGYHDYTCHDEFSPEVQFAQHITSELLERWRQQALICSPVPDATHIEWFPVKDGKIVDPRTLSRGLANQLNLKVLAMELSYKRLIILIDRYLAFQRDGIQVELNTDIRALPRISPPVPDELCNIEPVGMSITALMDHLLQPVASPAIPPVPMETNPLQDKPGREDPPARASLPLTDEAVQDLCSLGGAAVPLAVIRGWNEGERASVCAWAEATMRTDNAVAPGIVEPYMQKGGQQA